MHAQYFVAAFYDTYYWVDNLFMQELYNHKVLANVIILIAKKEKYQKIELALC